MFLHSLVASHPRSAGPRALPRSKPTDMILRPRMSPTPYPPQSFAKADPLPIGSFLYTLTTGVRWGVRCCSSPHHQILYRRSLPVPIYSLPREPSVLLIQQESRITPAFIPCVQAHNPRTLYICSLHRSCLYHQTHGLLAPTPFDSPTALIAAGIGGGRTAPTSNGTRIAPE